jgi:hypothetical protein
MFQMHPSIFIELLAVVALFYLWVRWLCSESDKRVSAEARRKQAEKERIAQLERLEATIEELGAHGLLAALAKENGLASLLSGPPVKGGMAKEAPAMKLEGGNDSPPAAFLGMLVPAVLLGGILIIIASAVSSALNP